MTDPARTEIRPESGAPARPNLKDFAPAALREHFREQGLPAYRADQVVGWLYTKGVDDLEDMTDLSRELRTSLAERYETRALEVGSVATSVDGTVKAALETRDGRVIEAVIIPEPERTTLCVSTQVGCPLTCSFCATGALGFTRNLSTAEIIDQVCRMQALAPDGRRITNIVFMGMGEPLLNLPKLVPAIEILLHPKAFAMAPRRVTVSTAGVVPQIEKLLDAVPVNLAVSLHAATDAVRDVLVPLNRKYPLAVLMETLRGLPRLSKRHPIFFEYTLMDGVNDADQDARRLVSLLRDLPAKLNVIPMNAHPDAPYRPPPPAVADRFMGILSRGGITTTLRRSRGSDIDAACGQLANREVRGVPS